MDKMNQYGVLNAVPLQEEADEDLRNLKEFELAAVGGGIADIIGI